ncbi:MAG: ABC transporter permease subunit [Acidilobaceae archaeon]
MLESSRAREALLWVLITLLSLIVILGFWHLASSALGKPYILPEPSSVLDELKELALSGELALHAGATLLRVSAALSIATVAAVASGIIATRTRLGKPLRVLVALLIPVPTLALLPLFMILFGFEVIKIALISAILYPILSIGVIEAISRLPREYEEVLASMGAGFTHLIRYVILPGIFMPLLTSLRICVGVSLSLTFVVESIVISPHGLGRYGLGALIETAHRVYDYETVYAGIIAVCTLGFTVYATLWIAETAYRRPRGL